MHNDDLAFDALATIDAVEASSDLDRVSKIYSAYVARYGFNSVAMCQLASPVLLQDPNSQIFMSTWPDEWARHWWESGYMQHDPIIQFLLKSRKPFSWDTARRHASQFGTKILDESTEFKFSNGIAFPISTGTGPTGCVSLGAPEVPFDSKILAMIEIVSINCYMHLIKLSGAESEYTLSRLSKRETEVMYYVAEGKSNWEIAQILGLSEHSIKSYLKTTATKLDTVNRAHAVSKAIRKGFIIS